MKINADTNAAEALKMGKGVLQVFNKYNLDCARCKGIVQETIGRIAFNKGLDPEKFIADLNKSLA